MADINSVRRIEIRATATGVDEVRAKLDGLANSQNTVARSADGLAIATETVSRRQLSAASNFERLQQRLDGTYRAQAQFAASLRDLDRAQSQGLVGDQRRAELIGLAAEKYGVAGHANENFRRSLDASTKNTGLARHELINLGRQAQDVATMFALGAPPMQIFASQAAQIGDIFASTSGSIGGFLRQAGGGLARFATSGLGLAAGAGAAGIWGATAAAGYLDAQREVEKALRGVGAASGVTLDQINRLADGQAAAARVSRASAREIATAFAATGRVNPSQLPGLLDFTKQFGASQGLGNADAAKELAGAFADPAKGAEELAAKLGGLNSAALRWIRDQQAAGNMLGAQSTLLDTFRSQVEGSTERVGLFARAWDGVKRSVSDADDALGRFLAGSNSVEQQLDALRTQRDRFAALPTRTQRATDHVAGLDAEIKRLEALVELDRQRAAIEERTQKAATSSRAASGISEKIDGYSTTLRELQADATKLSEAMKLNPGSGEFEAWARSLERVQGAMASILPTAERERLAHDLAMRAIAARTLAERTAIEIAREGLRLSGEKVSAAEREIAMQRKAAEVAAQATRDAQDALRASRDALAVAGKTPGERARIEADQRYRDNVERFGSAGASTALPETTGVLKNMDAAFAANLRRAMDDIPGLKITSGWRSMERQAELQREKPGWAASPTGSNHPKGLAADLSYNGSSSLPPELRARLERDYSLAFPLANRAVRPEPWHAEPAGLRNGRGAANSNGAADEIRSNELTAFQRNAIEGVIGNGTRQLAQQQQQLELTRQAWGMSAEEMAKAAKQQELVNALTQAGATMTPELRNQVDGLAAGYGRLAAQQDQVKGAQEAMKTLGDIGRSTLGGLYSDFRNGATGAEAFRNALDKIVSKLLDMAANDLFGKAFGNNAQGLFGSGGFFTGLFGGFGGGGSGLGTTPGAGGLYADGGYTGAGGKWDPRGIVHAGEVVWSQRDVASAGGVAVVEAMRRGMPGFASGGPVGRVVPPAPANANGDGKPTLSVSVINNVSGAQVETRQDEAGNLELVVDMVEGQMGRKAARGRGPLFTANRLALAGQNLRG